MNEKHTKTDRMVAKRARVRWPERRQVEMRMLSLEQILPCDDQARLVWQFVEGLDLTAFYQKIVVSDSQAGRTATAPEVLVALWLQATLNGIGSAREVSRRCEKDMRYRWICGDDPVNYHTLSDFRVEHSEALEQILTDSVAVMIQQKLVPLKTIAQDGMRVRASAGKSSFRRLPTLEKLQSLAAAHVQRLKEEAETSDGGDVRRQAAQTRAAEDKARRVAVALQQREELSKRQEKRKKGSGTQTRVSTTDPEARVMKMANGGYNPAYNVQFATDADARVIVAVTVSNEGADGGELAPMQAKVVANYEQTPEVVLVDSAYATRAGVTTVEQAGSRVVSTVPRADEYRKKGKDPHSAQKLDTPEFVAFRQRMAQDEYKEMYKQRPSIAEFPNAVCRNQNLQQFNVRGTIKVTAVALWHAIAFNFTRMQALLAASALKKGAATVPF